MYTVEERRNFQDLIRNERKARGWNQTEAGDVSGLGQRIISELERGPAPGTPFLSMARMAKTYGMSLDYIAQVLGIMDKPSGGEEPTGRIPGLSTDFFNMPAEEQARLVRIVNYAVYDHLNLSGEDGIHRVTPEKRESPKPNFVAAQQE